MYIETSNKDKVGSLITQLRAVRADLIHHRRFGTKVDINDYPSLTMFANLHLLETNGKFHQENVSRLEKAGIDVFKNETNIGFKMSGEIIQIPILV